MSFGVIVESLVKSGRGMRARAAVSPHTGLLAGSDVIADAAYRQLGIITIDNFEQMFDMAKALAMQPPAKGDRVYVMHFFHSITREAPLFDCDKSFYEMIKE